MPVEIHELQFHRNRVSGNFRALCSCGWCRVGADESEVRGLAATHDLDWEPVEAPKPANDAFWTGSQG